MYLKAAVNHLLKYTVIPLYRSVFPPLLLARVSFKLTSRLVPSSTLLLGLLGCDHG